jgi:transcriptional regulator with XRE-family HTH domain
MSGRQVRLARERLGLTQQQAAARWKMSQAYVSLVEHGRRPVPTRLARLLAQSEPSLATGLPVEGPGRDGRDLPRLLGSLGYPGFAYLGNRRHLTNPASVVLAALRAQDVPARVVEALPWMLATFVDLDWEWLVREAKLSNVQNRLGYLVGLARAAAEHGSLPDAARQLEAVEHELDAARLAKEDTLGRRLTDVEERHLREHRPAAAAHWNLLTNLKVEDLRYAV